MEKPNFKENNKKTKANTALKKRKENRKRKAVTVFNIIIFIISITSLYYTIRPYLFFEEEQVLRKHKPDGTSQAEIKKLPGVKGFIDHLKEIENKNVEKIWEEQISKNRKLKFSNKPLFFQYDYCLTGKYEIKYIIPLKIASDRIEFWALLNFEDNIDAREVKNIKQLANTELEEIVVPVASALVDEIYQILSSRFIISQDSVAICRNYIKTYVQSMSIKSIVQSDWRFPMLIAKDLKLTMKNQSNIEILSSWETQKHDIWCRVVSVKESNKWKVDEFYTEAISRWKD